MATQNKAVSVYLPPELESALADYCLQNGFTRKDKSTGEILPAFGTGLLEIAKQYFGNVPNNEKVLTSNPGNVPVLDKEEVEDLVKGYYAQAMEQMNGMLATLREEVDAKLGEFQA